MRGMIPAQAPYEGGEPTMRKGSYSEELVKNVRTDCGWTDYNLQESAWDSQSANGGGNAPNSMS